MKLIHKIAGIALFSVFLTLQSPAGVQAAQYGPQIRTSAAYSAKIQAPSAAILEAPAKGARQVGTVRRGQVCEVLEVTEDGWARLSLEEGDGYLRLSGQAALMERVTAAADPSAQRRREAVEYALQFVGGKYVYGGTDPNTGVDCSGFTRYIMARTAAIDLPHSSRGQASYGQEVPAEEIRPGDLLFYGNGKRINHVAMYIGEGQVVHASTAKTGIKTSPWDYRELVKAVSLL